MTAVDAKSSEDLQAQWTAEQRRRDPARYEAWAAVTVFFQAVVTDPAVRQCPPLRETLTRVGDMLVPRLLDTDDLTVVFRELEGAFQSRRARRPKLDPLGRWLAAQVTRHGDRVTVGQIRALLVAEFEATARHPWLLSPGSRDGEADVVFRHRGRTRRVDRSDVAQRLSRARKAWRELQGG